jgi:hypothetical protein
MAEAARNNAAASAPPQGIGQPHERIGLSCHARHELRRAAFRQTMGCKVWPVRFDLVPQGTSVHIGLLQTGPLNRGSADQA